MAFALNEVNVVFFQCKVEDERQMDVHKRFLAHESTFRDLLLPARALRLDAYEKLERAIQWRSEGWHCFAVRAKPT